MGDRFKKFENCYKQFLPDKTNVIVRVDGKAFHTLTRGMEKPFDQKLINAMVKTGEKLGKEMQSVKAVYIQSDEISIWMNNDSTEDTQAWFGNSLNKIVSVSASIATSEFNSIMGTKANFDSRCFILPNKTEVVNYMLWRSKDWERNSLSMYARSYYSAKELHGKSKADQHEMLHEKGVNWNDLHPQLKNGTLLIFDGSRMETLHPKPTYEDISNAINKFDREKIVEAFKLNNF